MASRRRMSGMSATLLGIGAGFLGLALAAQWAGKGSGAAVLAAAATFVSLVPVMLERRKAGESGCRARRGA